MQTYSSTEVREFMDNFNKHVAPLLKEFLTVDELVRYTGLSKSYIYKLTSKRTIPFYRPNGKKIYFRRSEIDQWLFSNKHISASDLELLAETYVQNKGGAK